MIAPRKKPLAYSFLPSFDNANDRLCRETLGTLRSDNGDANENVAEKQTSRPLKLSRP